MKLTTILLFASTSVAMAELPAKFIRAVHLVESGGKHGLILGDYDSKTKQYRSIGPLQIQRSYFVDSRIKGDWGQCTNLSFSIKVMEGYFTRYCPKALKDKNLQILAKTHNGGLNGPNNPKTKIYWLKIKKVMESSVTITNERKNL